MSNAKCNNDTVDAANDEWSEASGGVEKLRRKPERQIRRLTKPVPKPSSTSDSSEELKKTRKREIRKLVKPGSSDESRTSSRTTPKEDLARLDGAKETLKIAKEKLQQLLQLKYQSALDGKVLEEQTPSIHNLSLNKLITSQTSPKNMEHSTSEYNKDFCQNFHQILKLDNNSQTQKIVEISVPSNQLENGSKNAVNLPRSIKMAKLFEKLRARIAEKAISDDASKISQLAPTCTSTIQKNPCSLSSSMVLTSESVSSSPMTPLSSPNKQRQLSPSVSKQVNLSNQPRCFESISETSQVTPKRQSPVTASKSIAIDSMVKSKSSNQQSQLRQSSLTSRQETHLNNLLYRKNNPLSRRQTPPRNIDFDLDSVTYSKNYRLDYTKCFNCGRFGHQFYDCPEPSIGIFCVSCGWENVVKANCPFCTGKLVRPGSTTPVPIGGDKHKRF